jgi:acyl carrier protein
MKMSEDFMNDLIIFIKNEFPAIDFENNDKLVENGELDSLNLINLISLLEQEYDISIPIDEIIPENFNSLTSIYSLICKISKIG